VLLANVAAGGVTDLADYQHRGGGQALRQVLSMSPPAVIHELQISGLRGRGGAGFPAWRKWQALVDSSAARKYLVVNADEGDPGTFSDRLLLEMDPFRLLEACVIAAVTLGIDQGYIYLRAEYPEAGQVLQAALGAARRAGWLGPNLLGSKHHFELSLVQGKGSYICGEETAMLNAMEGLRPEVRVRPPQPTSRGLHGAPTLVHNVETLCAMPWILQRGGAAYAALGCGASRGTKLLSLNSLFRRPGLYEVEFGISLRRIVDELGGGLRRGQLKGVMLGGPLAGLVPPALLDTPLDYEALQAIGSAVGHGGVIAFTEDTGLAQIMAEVFRFGANESCGKCTPCHLGSPELARMFSDACAGKQVDAKRWAALVEALAATSLCGHGRGLAEFAQSIARHYPEELALCFKTS
jgi:formate dehydrogenase iron-sulfur subunit